MLVLTRKKGQAILVGDHVKITVVDICGDKVRLGVEAPQSLEVDREEVRETVERNGRRKKREE